MATILVTGARDLLDTIRQQRCLRVGIRLSE